MIINTTQLIEGFNPSIFFKFFKFVVSKIANNSILYLNNKINKLVKIKVKLTNKSPVGSLLCSKAT